MPRFLKPTIIFGVIGAAFLLLSLKTTVANTLFVPGMICAALAVVLLFMTIAAAVTAKSGKKLSGWRLFAIGDSALILVVGAIGAVDLITAEDADAFGPGLLGAIIFYYGLPVLAGLLIVELLAYKTVKMYSTDEPEPQPAPENKLPPKISYPPESNNTDNK